MTFFKKTVESASRVFFENLWKTVEKCFPQLFQKTIVKCLPRRFLKTVEKLPLIKKNVKKCFLPLFSETVEKCFSQFLCAKDCGKKTWTIFVSVRGVSVALPYPPAGENRQDSWRKKEKPYTVSSSFLNKYKIFCKLFTREIICNGRKEPTKLATVPSFNSF